MPSASPGRPASSSATRHTGSSPVSASRAQLPTTPSTPICASSSRASDLPPTLITPSEQSLLTAGIRGRRERRMQPHRRRRGRNERDLERAEALENAQIDALLRVRVSLVLRASDEIDGLELQR